MKIFATSAERPLAEHIEDIKNVRAAGSWRCFIVKLDRSLYMDPYAQRIALNYIEENYNDFDVYEFAFYWLKTGHVFVLFQGRMKKAHDTFEAFLNFVSEGEDAVKPTFDVYDMGKGRMWVEDAYEEALEELKELSRPKKPPPREEVLEEDKEVETEIDQHEEKRDMPMERAMRVKPLLLVVEDERMTQHFIEALIEPYCDVLIAETIEQGRAMYEEYWPNLVFMDINLPDGDGQDLTQELCEQDSDAYVVMVSAHISVEKIQMCKDVGARGFVAKPVTSDKERLLYMINQYNQDTRRIS